MKIHWSFFAMVLVLLPLFNFTFSANEFSNVVNLIAILMISVLIHEYGHALTARLLGLKVIDIIISAFGGLARVEFHLEKPQKNMVVALAGPSINLIVFLICYIYLKYYLKEYVQIGSLNTIIFTDYFNLVYKIGFINFLLFALNLIPALPLDGSKALRALLNLIFSNKVASSIALLISLLSTIILLYIGIQFELYYALLLALITSLFTTNEYFRIKNEPLIL